MSFPRNPKVKRHRGLAEQVADLLDAEITNGDFQPDEILPTEAALAQRFDVSRTVVREALARLKHDGILTSRQGGRTRVAKRRTARVFRLDNEPAHDEDWLGHLYELRLILEGESAALAARRCTSKQLADIQHYFNQLACALKNRQEATRESIDLHVAIIKASGNPHLTKLADWIAEKIGSLVKSEPDRYAEEKMKHEVQQEHLEIIQALENRDAALARKLARKHVLNAAQRHGIKIRKS